MMNLTDKQKEELKKQKVLAELKNIWIVLDGMQKTIDKTSKKIDSHLNDNK